MRRLLMVGVPAVVAALVLAGSGGAGFPGRNGRIVFADALIDQPGEGNSQVYELTLASGQTRNLSRNTVYDDTELALSPDGIRIAYVRAPLSAPWKGELWSMRRNGSAQRRLVPSLDLSETRELAWSPDGTKIAFIAESQVGSTPTLWVVDADGGDLRQLTSFWTQDPSWAPDGSTIAFAGRENAAVMQALHIGVTDPGGTSMRWLTPTPAANDYQGSESSPSWSPDGSQLAFVRGNALVLTGADGSGARTLTAETTNTGSPIQLRSSQWSPTGDEIGFVDDDHKLELIRPDGTELRTIASDANDYSWSPRSDRLAYMESLVNSVREVLVIQPLEGPRRLLQLPALGVGPTGGPVWSPSGQSLIYSDVRGPQDYELFSIEPHGARRRQLTRNNVDDFDPAYSPDGRRIAFARGRYGDPPSSLYVMNADGSHVRRLTRSPGSDTSPSWSPDNIHLVFARRSTKGPYPELDILDTKTGSVVPLAIGGATTPAWSPDGRLIAFSSNNKLKVIRPDGGGTRTLFNGGADTDVFQPTWSPNGRSIAFSLIRYFNGNPTKGSELVVSRTGGKPRTLPCPFSASNDEPGARIAWSPDGTAVAGVLNGIWICPLDGSPLYKLAAGSYPDWQPLH